jgi:hypothetical protein
MPVEFSGTTVEGLNKSVIARVERIGWSTVDRWLEKASDWRSPLQRSNVDGVQRNRASSRRDSNDPPR